MMRGNALYGSSYPWDGFRLVTGRVNQMTGEMIDIDPPIFLHGEDADWWADFWLEYDKIEYSIRIATLVAAQ